jgi:hypothetical protein
VSNRIEVQRLIHWLRNDVFDTLPGNRTEADLASRRGHNAAMRHVETVIIPRCLAEQSKCDEQG